MAGVGEASAVLAVVQVGLTLATALNTYISDVQDAQDNIQSLVSDIDATFGQLRDLGRLIEKNETTKAWSDDGLRNAKKCVIDCEKVIVKLRKLLKKTTASATSAQVDRDEIDITKLERARWPWYKARLEVYRRELQSIKQDIMIAYSSYMTKAGETDADRKKASEDIPRLKRTRKLVRRQVREAKEQRRRHESTRERRPPARLLRASAPRHYDNEEYRGVHYEEDFIVDGTPDFADDENGQIVFDDLDDLEQEFQEWLRDEELTKAEKENEKKKIQDEAVEKWRREQAEEVEACQQKTEVERRSLREELTKQRIAPQQIQEILDRLHPQSQDTNMLQPSLPTSPSSPKFQSEFGDNMDKKIPTRRWSLWSKKGQGVNSAFSTASTLVNEPQGIPVPVLLRDPTAEGGIAPLSASYFQRSLAQGQRVCNFDVEIPEQWLLDSLIKRQEAFRKRPQKVNSVWKEFAQLPDDYREAIMKHLSQKSSAYDDFDLPRPGSERQPWVLFHIERMYEKQGRGIIERTKPPGIVGVYMVCKKVRRISNRDGKTDRIDNFGNILEPVSPRRSILRSSGHDESPQIHMSPTSPMSIRSGRPIRKGSYIEPRRRPTDDLRRGTFDTDRSHPIDYSPNRHMPHYPRPSSPPIYRDHRRRYSSRSPDRDRDRGPYREHSRVSFTHPEPVIDLGAILDSDMRASAPLPRRNRSRSPMIRERRGRYERRDSIDSIIAPMPRREHRGPPHPHELSVVDEIEEISDSISSCSNESEDDNDMGDDEEEEGPRRRSWRHREEAATDGPRIRKKTIIREYADASASTSGALNARVEDGPAVEEVE